MSFWGGIKTGARWGLKLLTVGLIARQGKLKWRDVVPGIITAALVGVQVDSGNYAAIVDRVCDQIAALGLEKHDELVAQAYASKAIQGVYIAGR